MFDLFNLFYHPNITESHVLIPVITSREVFFDNALNHNIYHTSQSLGFIYWK